MLTTQAAALADLVVLVDLVAPVDLADLVVPVDLVAPGDPADLVDLVAPGDPADLVAPLVLADLAAGTQARPSMTSRTMRN